MVNGLTLKILELEDRLKQIEEDLKLFKERVIEISKDAMEEFIAKEEKREKEQRKKLEEFSKNYEKKAETLKKMLEKRK